MVPGQIFMRQATAMPQGDGGGGVERAPVPAGHYDALDSLRGICALLVAAYHFNPAALSLAGPLLANAYLFVDFFFVLSGFVIAHAYGDKLRSVADLKPFIVRRVARLYPLHVFALAPYVALELLRFASAAGDDRVPFTGIRSIGSLLANLAMVQGLGVLDRLTWNGVSWSVSSELWTYGLFALLVLSSGRFRKPVFAFASLAAMVSLVLLAPRDMNLSYDFGLVRCFAGFFAGALLQQACFAGAKAGRKPPEMVATAIEVAVIAACVLFVSFAGDTRLSLAAPIVFVAVVAVFARERGGVSRILVRPGLTRIGALSYAIYMIHPFFVYVAFTLAKIADSRFGLPLTAPFAENGTTYTVFQLPSAVMMDVATIGFAALVVLVSIPVHRLVELPMRRRVTESLLGAGSVKRPAPRPPGSDAALTRMGVKGEAR